MYIKKLHIENYKLYKNITIELNEELNIFVGNNDSGKSTLLEVISILTTGKVNGYAFDRNLKASFFNVGAKHEYLDSIKKGEFKNPPSIILEAYFEGMDAMYCGTNNTMSENCSGISVQVSLDEDNGKIYKELLKDNKLTDIPVELYSVKTKYFSGEKVYYRKFPVNSFFVDTTRKDYSNLISKFVDNTITENLTQEQITNLSLAYRQARNVFHENEIITDLNNVLKEKMLHEHKGYSIDIKEETVDEWKNDLSIMLNDIPFENLGFGTQNIIKTELAVNNNATKTNILMLEEPENNLSYSNMTTLVSHLLQSKNEQVFISTHSSFIANKLQLNNLLLMNNGVVTSFSRLDKGTQNYFSKLPGYDTLRFILANRVILVEGPTDDLIIQRAYKDRYGVLPSDKGIDIIAVNGLDFKRYLDIAKITGKEVAVVTDNDGNINKKINDKYSEYLSDDFIHFFYEKNDELTTIEPSVLNVNLEEGKPSKKFESVLSKNGSLKNADKERVRNYMTNNKTEWALRVFESEESINYPEYIQNVVKEYC